MGGKQSKLKKERSLRPLPHHTGVVPLKSSFASGRPRQIPSAARTVPHQTKIAESHPGDSAAYPSVGEAKVNPSTLRQVNEETDDSVGVLVLICYTGIDVLYNPPSNNFLWIQ